VIGLIVGEDTDRVADALAKEQVVPSDVLRLAAARVVVDRDQVFCW
jgi:hypothetical protein